MPIRKTVIEKLDDLLREAKSVVARLEALKEPLLEELGAVAKKRNARSRAYKPRREPGFAPSYEVEDLKEPPSSLPPPVDAGFYTRKYFRYVWTFFAEVANRPSRMKEIVERTGVPRSSLTNVFFRSYKGVFETVGRGVYRVRPDLFAEAFPSPKEAS
jgi:hypothetical protein